MKSEQIAYFHEKEKWCCFTNRLFSALYFLLNLHLSSNVYVLWEEIIKFTLYFQGKLFIDKFNVVSKTYNEIL